MSLKVISSIKQSDKILNKSIGHAFFLEQYKTGEFHKLLPEIQELVNKTMQEVTLRLESTRRFSPRVRVAKLRGTLRRIERRVIANLKGLDRQLRSSLSDLPEVESRILRRHLRESLDRKVGIRAPHISRGLTNNILVQGQTISEWFKQIRQGVVRTILQTVRSRVLQVDSNRIIQTVLHEGIQKSLLKGIELVTRSSVTAVANEVRKSVFEENSNLIQRWLFSATLDDRTSLICLGLDGTTWPIGRGPYPPVHPFCRSISVPLLSQRIPKTVTATEWLRELSSEEQDKVLGKSRANLFRSKKISARDLLNNRNKVLSLKDLEQRG